VLRDPCDELVPSIIHHAFDYDSKFPTPEFATAADRGLVEVEARSDCLVFAVIMAKLEYGDVLEADWLHHDEDDVTSVKWAT
jgi:hypothetical protein